MTFITWALFIIWLCLVLAVVEFLLRDLWIWYGPISDKPTPNVISWDIEEYKIWKGIDKETPCWASLGWACGSWDSANSILVYMNGNKPKAILRVISRTY
jgi:hypothetical protein